MPVSHNKVKTHVYNLFFTTDGSQAINCFLSQEFWIQLKSAGMVIKCHEHFMRVNAEKLKLAKSGDGKSALHFVSHGHQDFKCKAM